MDSTSERSLNRQVVLEEDEYTAALSQIIARDFFPSLVHLDATNDYLDALDSRDPHLINASVRRLQEFNTPAANRRAVHWATPSRTPYGAGPSETPLPAPSSEPSNKRPRYDASLPLDDFQSRYTSEDNSSFTRILDDENRKRKEQWAWAWDAEKKVQDQRCRMLEKRERMFIEAPPVPGVKEKFAIEMPKPAGLIADGRDSEDSETKELGVTKSSSETTQSQVDVMAPTKDTRSAGVEGWKFKARNSLMFPPDADTSPYDPPVARTEGEPDPKLISYGNTRLPEQNDTLPTRPLSAPPSPSRSHINAAIAGTPYHPGSPTSTNFSLVPNMPSPTPSELGPAAVKQLMTWGTLNATPRIISQTDDPAIGTAGPSFQIPAPSPRERLSNKLSSKASKSLREKAGLLGLGQLTRTPGIRRTPRSTNAYDGKKGSMAPPSWTPRRAEAAANLTPAARKLLDRTTMGTAAIKRTGASAGVVGNAVKETDLNRVRWTPTPNTFGRKE